MYSQKLLLKMTKNILDEDLHRKQSDLKTSKQGSKETYSR